VLAFHPVLALIKEEKLKKAANLLRYFEMPSKVLGQ